MHWKPQHMSGQIYERCFFQCISFIKCKFQWPVIYYRTVWKAANTYYLSEYLGEKRQTGAEDFICHFPSNLPLSPRRQLRWRTGPVLFWSASCLEMSSYALLGLWKAMDYCLYCTIFYLFQLHYSTGCRPEGTERHTLHSPCITLYLTDSKRKVLIVSHPRVQTVNNQQDKLCSTSQWCLGDTVSTQPLLRSSSTQVER